MLEPKLPTSTPVEAFESLKGRQNRLSTLHAILDNLDKHERRAMADRFNRMGVRYLTEDLRFDVVGSPSLPLELLLMIFSYLDPVAPFLLQRVSKRWRQVLRDPTVLDASLALWYSPNDMALAGQAPERARSEEAIRKLKLEHIGRFRTGRPSSIAEVILPTEWVRPGTIQSYRSFLACFDYEDDPRFISVIHLPSAKVRRFGFSSRSQINCFTMGDDYLVMTSMKGRVCAVNLITWETQIRRIPVVTGRSSIAIAGQVIWLVSESLSLVTPLEDDASDKFICAKWDLSTGSCCSVPLDWTPAKPLGQDQPLPWLNVFFGPKTKKLSLLEYGRRRCSGYCASLSSGSRPADVQTFDIEVFPPFDFDYTQTRSTAPLSLVSNGGCRQLPFVDDWTGLGFDPNDARFVLLRPGWGITRVDKRFKSAQLEGSDQRYVRAPSQFWKDTRYILDCSSREFGVMEREPSCGASRRGYIYVRSPQTSCADSLVVSTQHSEYVGAEFGFRLDVMTEIVGNETFMSIITAKQEGGRTTMDLLCFDPDIDVSGIKKELTFDEPPRLV